MISTRTKSQILAATFASVALGLAVANGISTERVVLAAVPSDSEESESVLSNPRETAEQTQKIDGPAEWKKAAEAYNKRNHDVAPELKARYTILNLYEGLTATLYDAKDFAAIEAILEKRLAKISDPWAAREYERIVNVVGSLRYKYEPEQMLAVVKEWTDKRPDSHFSWLVRGKLAVAYAWYWRGTGYTSSITEEGSKNYERYLREAYEYFQKAYELKPSDPAVSVGLLRVAADAGLPEKQFNQLFDQVTSIDPAFYPAYFIKFRQQTPKWGGSWERVDAFVAECEKKSLQFQNPLLLFIKIDAFDEMASNRPGYENILKTPEYKSTFLQVHRAVLGRWPDEIEPHASYCKFLYDQNKYSEALEQFKWLGDRYYYPSFWSSIWEFNAGRAFTIFMCADKLTNRDECIAQIREAIKLSPHRGDYYFRLALEYRKVKDYKETEKLYEQGLEAQPQEWRNWMGLAGLYRELGRYQDLQNLVEDSRQQKFDEKYHKNLEDMYVDAGTHVRK